MLNIWGVNQYDTLFRGLVAHFSCQRFAYYGHYAYAGTPDRSTVVHGEIDAAKSRRGDTRYYWRRVVDLAQLQRGSDRYRYRRHSYPAKCGFLRHLSGNGKTSDAEIPSGHHHFMDFHLRTAGNDSR